MYATSVYSKSTISINYRAKFSLFKVRSAHFSTRVLCAQAKLNRLAIRSTWNLIFRDHLNPGKSKDQTEIQPYTLIDATTKIDLPLGTPDRHQWAPLHRTYQVIQAHSEQQIVTSLEPVRILWPVTIDIFCVGLS